MRPERGIEIDKLDLLGGALSPDGQIVSGQLIADIRAAIHQRIDNDDVKPDDLTILTLCRRHEELVVQALRMEGVIHEYAKELR